MLEDVSHAQHHDSVADDQHPLATVLARDHLGGAAQAENDVAPALPAGGTVVELSQQSAEFRLVGKLLFDANGGESIKNSKLLFAKPLIHDQGIRILAHAGGFHHQTGTVPRTQIR